MKKSRFTIEEHRDVGAQLELIRNDLTDLSVEIYNAYPRNDVSDDLDKAIKCIDKSRSELDDQLFKENSDLGNMVLENIYYGNPSVKNSRS